MAAPPDPQDQLLQPASPGFQWSGDWGEGEDEAVTPTEDMPKQQAGEAGRGLGAGVGPRDPGSGPARPPPVAMETASTGKAGAVAPRPLRGPRLPGAFTALRPEHQHQPHLTSGHGQPEPAGSNSEIFFFFLTEGSGADRMPLLLFFPQLAYVFHFTNSPPWPAAASWPLVVRRDASFSLLLGLGAAWPPESFSREGWGRRARWWRCARGGDWLQVSPALSSANRPHPGPSGTPSFHLSPRSRHVQRECVPYIAGTAR